MENAADNTWWICLCEFAKICFHVSICIEFNETLGFASEEIMPVQSAGLVQLRSNNQLCLLDLGVLVI